MLAQGEGEASASDHVGGGHGSGVQHVPGAAQDAGRSEGPDSAHGARWTSEDASRAQPPAQEMVDGQEARAAGEVKQGTKGEEEKPRTAVADGGEGDGVRQNVASGAIDTAAQLGARVNGRKGSPTGGGANATERRRMSETRDETTQRGGGRLYTSPTRISSPRHTAPNIVNKDVQTTSFIKPKGRMGRPLGEQARKDEGPSKSSPAGSGKVVKKQKNVPAFLHKFEKVLGHVNQYILFEEIGRGAQGTVYKCLNKEDNQTYAIKCLERASLKRRQKPGIGGQVLKNEIEVMKQLDHPNLVRLYEVIDDSKFDRLYLVMDYVNGGSVMGDSDIMNCGNPLSNAIPEDEARRLFYDFIQGMEQLHQSGILHRDIKPSNLLIDPLDDEPKLKVCDFGVSTLCSKVKSAKVLGEDDLVYVGEVGGTPAMRAPEALGAGRDPVYHGRSADVWAGGVTLFCMLFGMLPFRGNTPEETIRQIIELPVVFPSKPKVSKEARRLISRMLDKDPQARGTFSLAKLDPWFEPLPAFKQARDAVAVSHTESSSQLEEMMQEISDTSTVVSEEGLSLEGLEHMVPRLHVGEAVKLSPVDQPVIHGKIPLRRNSDSAATLPESSISSGSPMGSSSHSTTSSASVSASASASASTSTSPSTATTTTTTTTTTTSTAKWSFLGGGLHRKTKQTRSTKEAWLSVSMIHNCERKRKTVRK